MKTSVIIPSYNGVGLLEKNLPKILCLSADEFILVDDGSSDNTSSWLRDNYPQVKIIRNEKNLGFIKSVNKAVAASIGDLVILLNNDVAPQEDFTVIINKYFENPKVFAVSFNEPNWSYARGEFVKGFIEHSPGPKTDKPHISLWASGGSAAFSKKLWSSLGGFDEVYEPFYWEDTDLSYRAWKSGLEVWWEPKAVVTHQHETTIASGFSKKYIEKISERNRLLFIWKNITDKDLLDSHKKSLFKKLINPGYWEPFLKAVIRKKLIKQENYKISDKEIFEKFK